MLKELRISSTSTVGKRGNATTTLHQDFQVVRCLGERMRLPLAVCLTHSEHFLLDNW